MNTPSQTPAPPGWTPTAQHQPSYVNYDVENAPPDFRWECIGGRWCLIPIEPTPTESEFVDAHEIEAYSPAMDIRLWYALATVVGLIASLYFAPAIIRAIAAQTAQAADASGRIVSDLCILGSALLALIGPPALIGLALYLWAKRPGRTAQPYTTKNKYHDRP